MKFRVTMKTPDALDEAIQEIIQSDMVNELDDGSDANEILANLDDDELERRIDEVKDACEKWFENGEYLTVEIDTEAQTCVVVAKGE